MISATAMAQSRFTHDVLAKKLMPKKEMQSLDAKSKSLLKQKR